ncbi:unnamed protein product [Clonostachys rosea f. rosea IK726]|uniref:Uncharacterized protein n=1 Tax=Clonostachys rosea f. rosea IK726 TaxID=1349383 RepID=A0ACA9U3B9_BIOOC|nr:unnamed protein product [Clonostachys rosea f. rosea IK726]
MAKRKSGLLQAFAQVLGKPPKKSRKKSHKKSKPASDSGKSESPDEPAAKSKGKAPPKEEVGEPSTAPPKEKSEKEKKMDALKAKKKGLKSQLETTEGKIRQTEKQYCDNEMKFINWWQKRTDIGTQAANQLAQLRMDAYKERKDQLLADLDKLEREGDKLWKKIGHAKVDIRVEEYSDDSSDSSDFSDSSSDFSFSSDSSY